VNTPVIEFEKVHKFFTVHHDRPRSFKELAVSLVKRGDGRREELQVLRGVSFAVGEGEVLGIIGENGAGKTTILNLIAGIIEPTSGKIGTRGRVSTLLELGTGFHPDLTGRENIYLNGAILGLGKKEMDQKFDKIIEFSELGRFIDMPLRHYSAGMYMRLGFSIAIYVEPEILLVDEVLAVGDESFQTKCLDKINEFKDQGVSIVFVSHALDSVRSLCDRAVWLDEGRIAAKGPVEKVVDSYMQKVVAGKEAGLKMQHGVIGEGERWGTGEAEIIEVQFLDAQGKRRHVFETDERMVVRIKYLVHRRIEKPVFGVGIHRNDGLHVNGPNTKVSNYDIPYIEGEGEIVYTVENLSLLEGTYEFSAAIYDYDCVQPYDHHERAYSFMVKQSEMHDPFGVVHLPAHWEHRPRTDV
jgi:ABC-type polysaccharide/polyol phosphate transport system ATPase subunit